MSPVQPGGVQQSQRSDEDAIRSWLDALAGGKCDQAAFLQAMQENFRFNPEANWEVLSQLDQYFRRGRIPAETFQAVKKVLAEFALRVAAREPEGDALEAPAATLPLNPVGAPDTETHGIPIARDVVDSSQRRGRSASPDAIGEPRPGSVLRRRYRLESLLGQGSSGPVFQAVDEYRLDSPRSLRLAVKIFHPAVVKRAELLAEVQCEFQALQFLSHPNIVRVFEFDRDGSLAFFTMELLSGATLSRVMQARKLLPLPKGQAFAAIRDIGSALAYAHSLGVVHGDINPRSIFVTAQGDLRLLGFPGSFKGPQNPTALDHELSLPIATSGYASCQILEGKRADSRDDVFALACVAYLLLCGEHPLKQITAIEARAAKATPKRPAQLNHRQWQALRAGLRWEREDRPADVKRWLAQLDLPPASTRFPPLRDLLELPPRKDPRPPWRAVTAVAAVLLLAAAVWFIGFTASSRAPVSQTPPAIGPASLPPTARPPSTASPPSISNSPPATPPPTATTPVAAAPVTAAPVAAGPVAAPPVAAQPVTTTPAASRPAAVAPPRSSKVELAADRIDVPSGETEAQVSVHRKGSLRGETSFTWWTESGTAKPGAEFSAVVPQIARIGDGKSSVTLSIPLRNTPRAQPKSFYVVIDQTEGGAALAGRTLMMVTLQPPN